MKNPFRNPAFQILAPFTMPAAICFAFAKSPLAFVLLAAFLLIAVATHRVFGNRGVLGTDPAGTYQQGGVKFGSQKVTISTVDYVASDIDYEVGSSWGVRKNEVGKPDGQFGQLEVGEGSLTLQLATQTTAAPPMFGRFSIKDVDGTVTIAVVIAHVGRRFTQNGEAKVPIKIREDVGA